ncbi:hypothetical protein PR048_020287, partial [Dryococelus australis]
MAQDFFFHLLLNIIDENDQHIKPQYILNVDETGIQLINKPDNVITTKGSKIVHKVISGEKGETVSFIACCSAELIKIKIIWKVCHQVLRFVWTPKLTDENDVILLCLPPNATRSLQKLDKAFFDPFKVEYNKHANSFMKTSTKH